MAWPELAPSVESAELGRMVLDDVVPRRASDGRIVMPGHVGYSYQAVGGSRTSADRPPGPS